MNRLIFISSLVITNLVYGQCGSVFNHGVEYKIPCDWDYTKHIQDSLDNQEKIFIELINSERIAKGLQPLTYSKQIESDVSDIHCRVLQQKNLVHHPNTVTMSYYHVDVVTGVMWCYMDTDVGFDAYLNFKNSTKSHWQNLMDPYHKKISVSFLPSRVDTEKTKGKVFVVCTLSN